MSTNNQLALEGAETLNDPTAKLKHVEAYLAQEGADVEAAIQYLRDFAKKGAEGAQADLVFVGNRQSSYALLQVHHAAGRQRNYSGLAESIKNSALTAEAVIAAVRSSCDDWRTLNDRVNGVPAVREELQTNFEGGWKGSQ